MKKAIVALLAITMVLMATTPTPVGATDSGDTWTTVAPLLTGRWAHGAVAGPDERIYAIGGNTGPADIAQAEAYTPSTNTWTSIAPMPSTRSHMAVVTGPDGRIYVIGGHLLNTAVAYNPTTNTWSAVAAMPTYVGNHICAAVGLDGRIYTIGNDSRMDAYNPSTNTWTTVFPVAFSFPSRRGCAAVTGLDGRIYIMGGTLTTADAHNIVEIYDPASNTRTVVAPMPTPRFGLGAALGPDGRIYAIGGFIPGTTTTSAVEAYDPSTNTWTAVASMPDRRGALAAATGPDGQIYAIGGLRTGNPVPALNVVESYNPLPATTTTIDLALSAPTMLPIVGGQYAPNPFEIVATVTNRGAIAAQEVKVILYLPSGLSLAESSLTQAIGDLPVGQQAQVTWSMQASGQSQETTLSYFATAVASNAEARSVTRQITLPGGALTVASITSNVGGDTGSVTATMHGGGFRDGAVAKLVRDGESDIGGNNIAVAGDGFSLSATFDLKSKPRGAWNVVVTNPDGISAALPNAFLIEEGRAAQVWLDTLGRETVRAGREQSFHITYGNHGNTDALSVPLWITGIPRDTLLRLY